MFLSSSRHLLPWPLLGGSPAPAAGEALIEIGSLPEWAQPGFKGMKSLNRIQSRVCDCALYSSEVRRCWRRTVGQAGSLVVQRGCCCLICCPVFVLSSSTYAACCLLQNMLVCAPTGAGKTNVAMLTMLHEIGLHRWAVAVGGGRWHGGYGGRQGGAVLCCVQSGGGAGVVSSPS